MRKITFAVANSLDNYIARDDHSIDWLLFSEDVKRIMEEFWPTIDAVVMGRKTYEVALEQSSGAGAPPFGGVATYVLSRSMTWDPERDKGVEIVSDDAVRFVADLKSRDGTGIMMMGGGESAKPLIEAGLIDELAFNIHPVLLGSGVPLFHGLVRQIELELLGCKAFSNGCVYVRYRVLGAEARS